MRKVLENLVGLLIFALIGYLGWELDAGSMGPCFWTVVGTLFFIGISLWLIWGQRRKIRER